MTALSLWLVFSLVLAQEPPSAEVLAPSAPPGAAEPLGEVASPLEPLAAALEGWVERGEVPRLGAEQLFEVDPLDERQVTSRIGTLERALAQAEEGPEARLIRARLAFLRLPLDRRVALLVGLEQELAALRAREQAEAERQRAEAEAEQARGAQERALAAAQEAALQLDRDLASERARLERLRAEAAEQDSARAEARQAQLAQLAILRGQARELSAIVDAADAVDGETWDALWGVQLQALSVLRSALAELDPGPPAALPQVEPSLLARDLEEVAALETLALELARRQAETEQRRVAASLVAFWEAVDLDTEVSALRAQAFARLAPAARRALLGVSDDGLEAVRLELTHARTRVQVWRAEVGLLADLRWRSVGVDGVVALLRGALTVLVLGGLVWTALRRASRLANWIAERLRARARPLPALRGLAQEVGAQGPRLLGDLILLLGALLLPAALGVGYRSPLLHFGADAALWYSTVRVVVGLLHTLVRSTAPAVGARDTVVHRVAQLGQYIFLGGVLIASASAVVGPGVLSTWVVRSVWLGGVALAAAMVHWGRAGIVEELLEQHPQGRLAQLVRAAQGRPHAPLLALVAFVAIATEGGVRAVRRYAMRIGQVRRALGLVMGQRAQEGRSLVRLGPPPKIAQALAAGPLEPGSPLWVEDPVGTGALIEALSAWKDGRRRFRVALVGTRGSGRTTWLNHALPAFDLPVHRIQTGGPTTAPDEILRRLADGIGCPEVGLDGICGWLMTHGRALVVIDDLHLWSERSPGGGAGWEALGRVVSGAGQEVGWLVTVLAWPWQHAVWAGRALPFDTLLHLGRWPEDHLGQLLLRRLEGERLDLGALTSGQEAEQEQQEALMDFIRVLSDDVDGNPASALIAWRQSLEPCEDRMQVLPYPRPPQDVLDTLSQEVRFVLAATAWNGFAEAGSATRTLALPPDVCSEALRALINQGVLGPGTEPGSCALTAEWWAPALRYLRRQNLLGV